MGETNLTIDNLRKMELWANMTLDSISITPLSDDFNSQTQVNSIKSVQSLSKERAVVAKVCILEKDEKKLEQCIEHIDYINKQIKLILGL